MLNRTSKIAFIVMAILFLLMSAQWFGMAVPVILLALLSGASAVLLIAALVIPD